MKKISTILPIFILLAATSAPAADVGFDLNINIGNRPRVAVPVPAPPPPQIAIHEPPDFILSPALGFYAAVGVPYDLFFLSGNYYLVRGNVWYSSPRYNGPWHVVSHQRLPPGLRKHKYERIRHYRDEECRIYESGRGHYRGRHFRPEKEWKERRKEEHAQSKEEKRWEKEERKQNKHKRSDG